eukprot:TRINITY_DN10864_c0_g1_i1.p2 TRINITY_DN10864_c0_g1~~TRINITY_DN10864_c0_g1_i1.p2  ORF type:complete len:535 (+),score=192.74 TRINITY_DN10864_c0_g1_i1:105-1709(+)
MSDLENLKQELESVYDKILAAAPAPAKKRPATAGRTPGKTPRKAKAPAVSLLDLDVEGDFSSGEGFALVLRARRELRQRLDELSVLKKTVQDLQAINEEKDTEAIQATSSLANVKAENDSLTSKVSTLRSQVATLTEEKKLLRKEVEASGGAAIRKPSDSPGKDNASFHMLTQLENIVRMKDGEIQQFKDELRGKDAQLRAKTKEITKLTRESKQRDSSKSQVVVLEGKVKMLKRQIDDQNTEIKTMERMFRLKSQAMERESKKLLARPELSTTVAELQNELKIKNKLIRDLEDEKKLLNRMTERKGNALVKATAESEADPFAGKAWQDERRVLKTEITQLKEKLATSERARKASDAQVLQLSKRIDSFARLQDSAAPESLASANGKVDVEGTAGDNDENAVPASMYDLASKENSRLSKLVKAKETALRERDFVIEGLERKVNILNKARSVDGRKGRQEATTMSRQMQDMKHTLQQKTELFKSRELHLKMSNIRLKNQLTAANQYIQESISNGQYFDPNLDDSDRSVEYEQDEY